jgi:hypothetical protein
MRLPDVIPIPSVDLQLQLITPVQQTPIPWRKPMHDGLKSRPECLGSDGCTWQDSPFNQIQQRRGDAKGLTNRAVLPHMLQLCVSKHSLVHHTISRGAVSVFFTRTYAERVMGGNSVRWLNRLAYPQTAIQPIVVDGGTILH